MTENSTSLENLHDIVVPDPVTWWPLAPGWYVIGLILLIAVIWISVRLIQHWRGNRFRREALSELENINPPELPALVKRVALSVAPREQVASLSGDDWLQFLDHRVGGTDFTDGPGKILPVLSCSPDNAIDENSSEFAQLKTSVRRWIQNA